MPDSNITPQPFRDALPRLLLIASVFLVNFISRICFSPLMPAIENDLGLTHSQAGELFFFVGAGACTGLTFSGFVARALLHRRTIILSSALMGGVMLLMPLCRDATQLKAAIYMMATAAGLYLPSGIATITSLVRRQDWGKAMSVHEMAPNSSFILAPLFAELVLSFASWRTTLGVLGILNLCMAAIYFFKGKGGDFPGQAPSPKVLASLFRQPVFWLLALFFCVAVGMSLGPYSMIPLYLVDMHDFSRSQANQLLAVSRVSGLLMSLYAGYVTDRLGIRKTIAIYFVLAGMSTVALGLFSGKLLVGAVLIQPALSVCFFPAAFTAISIFFDTPIRSTATSLITPTSALIGVGVIPAIIGHLGDLRLFHIGFIGLGLLPVICLALLPFLRMKKGEWEELNMPRQAAAAATRRK